MPRRRLLLVIGLVVFAIFSCRKQIEQPIVHHPPPQAIESVSLRLAWLPGATFAGDYVALTHAEWKRRNLAVELRPGGFEYDAIKLVAAGADTFGVSSGPQLLQARASGVPIVAIGATIPQSPIGWVAKKISRIRRPQDFVGKRVGAQFGTHTEITLEALCAKLGISPKSFRRIPIKFDPTPFVSGAIDVLPVYLIDQPVDLEAEGIQLNMIDPGDYGVSLAYGNVYFTSEETLRKRPDMVRRFLAGARAGWIFAEGHRDEAAGAILSVAPDINRDRLRKKLELTFAFINKTSGMQYKGIFPTVFERWSDTASILARYGEMQSNVKVNDAFTNEYLNDR